MDIGEKTVRTLLCWLLLSATFPSYATIDYAAWSAQNRDGSWTRAAEAAVAQSVLPKIVPQDVSDFCPTYKRLKPKERHKFWVGLMSAMAKPESNFDPNTYFKERFTDAKGRRVISRGLLQISIESANQKRYDCDIPHAELLHDPVVNLNCGVKILAKWVKEDGIIASQATQGTHKGGGRYWSTLRAKTGHLNSIQSFTRDLVICQRR